MSVVYSEYDCNPIYKWFKESRKLIPGTTDEEKFAEYSRFFLGEVFKDSDKDEDRTKMAAWISKVHAVNDYKFGKVSHFFLEEGLYSFLVESAKRIDSDYWKPESFKIKENESIFIHSPTKENSQSICVFRLPFWLYSVPHYCVRVGGKNKFNIILCEDISGILPKIRGFEENDERIKFSNETARLALGLSLYIDAFPDVIREADGVKHIGHYKGNRHYIRANDIVRTEAHHSVSPHFRRGHFRVLRSDKFKAARGKTIFINGMFVKGKAFDVLADDK